MEHDSQDIELLLTKVGRQERDFPLDDRLGLILAAFQPGFGELSRAELSQVVAAGGRDEVAASWRIWQKLQGR